MRVSQLYIYPIKSGPAVSVSSAEALERGLAHDRRFMVVDEEGGFLSQRTHPALGRASVHIDAGSLVIEVKGHGMLEVPLQRPEGTATEVRLWGDAIEAVTVSADADAFYSELVGQTARLVAMPPQSRRIEPTTGVQVSFADVYPVLVTTTASLDDLNRRLEQPVPMLAFRPNIVVETTAAWDEDTWAALRLGDAELECTTLCERCTVVNLDPAWPDRPRPGNEPLRTLASFRRDPSGKVVFGRNAIVRRSGVIRAGSQVEFSPDLAEAFTRPRR